MSPGGEIETPAVAVKAEDIQWDVDMEVQLFYAMAPHKPVGVNKHFHMAAIWYKLNDSITRDITTGDIWRHLDTLYEIHMLDDTEPVPFPNEELEFSLPECDFGEHIKKKGMDVIYSLADYNEPCAEAPSPPLTKSLTPKNSLRSTSKDSTPKSRKESTGGSRDGTKTRKESGSSHASTDTPSNRSDKDYGSRSDRRRDSRDSNASGTRDSSSGRKSTSHTKTPKSRTGRTAAEVVWGEDKERTSRGRRRANASTPPPPAKRRRT